MLALTAKRARSSSTAPNSLAAPVPPTEQRKGRVFYQLLTQNWWYCRKTVKKDDTGQALHQDCLGGWLKQPLAQGKDRPLHKDMPKQNWGPQLAEKELHGEAKITKRRGREMEAAAQICQIAVLDHQN